MIVAVLPSKATKTIVKIFIEQVKQERALQEQASTYLQLVCSACDLAEPRVREAAGAIQQIKLQVGSLF